jgi:predicted ester cyclase
VIDRAERERVVVESWEASWGRGDVDVLDDFMDPDYRRYTTSGRYRAERRAQTLAEFKSDITTVRSAFPDLETTIDDLLVDGERVAVRWETAGTNTEPFMDVPPTGRRIRVTGVTISRFAGQRIQEDWVTWDRSEILYRLGIVSIGAA